MNSNHLNGGRLTAAVSDPNAKYISLEFIRTAWGQPHADYLFSRAETAGSILAAREVSRPSKQLHPCDIPRSSAHKFAALFDSLFARNPWHWAYTVTVRLDHSVESIQEAYKRAKSAVKYAHLVCHGYLWILQVHADHFAVRIIVVPGFDCHKGSDIKMWTPTASATQEQKLAAMNPLLRAETVRWQSMTGIRGAEFGPIYDLNALRSEFMDSVPPEAIDRLLGKRPRGCSQSVRDQRHRFPSVRQDELRAAWNLEQQYRDRKPGEAIPAEVWHQPRYPYPKAPTHPLKGDSHSYATN
jgi:hypothetical protein